MIHICSKFQENYRVGGCAPIKSQLGGSDPPSPLFYTTAPTARPDGNLPLVTSPLTQKLCPSIVEFMCDSMNSKYLSLELDATCNAQALEIREQRQ